MKINLKLFISSSLVAINVVMPQIHSSKAMEDTKPITLAQPDGRKMALKVYFGHTLSDLRAELISKNRILPSDIFQREGSDIYRDDETNWTIKEVITNNVLSLKSGDSISSHLFGNAASNTLHQEGGSQKKQENFVIRQSMIDECINQYKILTKANLTWLELSNACLEINPLYKERQRVNHERNEKDESCDDVLSCWLMNEYGIALHKKNRDEVELIPLEIPNGDKMMLIAALKKDMLESMKIYKSIYGHPHPRLNQLGLEQEEAASQCWKDLQDAELQEKQRIFAFRGSKVEECIEQFKFLENEKINYGQLEKVLKNLLVLYNGIIDDYGALAVFEYFSVISPIITHIENLKKLINICTLWYPKPLDMKYPHMQVGYDSEHSIAEIPYFGGLIKADLFESIEMHKELHGQPHPRWDEFRRLQLEKETAKEEEMSRRRLRNQISKAEEEASQKLLEATKEKKRVSGIKLRCTRIDDVIKQISLLMNDSMTCGNLKNILNSLTLGEYNSDIAQRIRNLIYCAENLVGSIELRNPYSTEYVSSNQNLILVLKAIVKCMKEEVVVSMDHYELLAGSKHNRWNEFSEAREELARKRELQRAEEFERKNNDWNIYVKQKLPPLELPTKFLEYLENLSLDEKCIVAKQVVTYYNDVKNKIEIYNNYAEEVGDLLRKSYPKGGIIKTVQLPAETSFCIITDDINKEYKRPSESRRERSGSILLPLNAIKTYGKMEVVFKEIVVGMEMYDKLTGISHPSWEEFSKM